MITIRHTHLDGTILEGSVRGDGVYEIVRRPENGGFVWRRSVGIFIRGSRDKDAQQHKINAAAAALRAAGFDVEIDIDNQWRTAAEREADRGARSAARVERLTERSGTASARADAAHERARSIADRLPFGQPILVGHHSEGRARRDHARIDAGMRRSVAEAERAEHLQDRARGAAAHEAHKHNPRAIARRIETLEADVRRDERDLAEAEESQASDGYLDALRRRIARATEEIDHLRGKLAAMAETGEFVAWTRDHFRKGDKANIGSDHWVTVRRVNTKSVSVPGLAGSDGDATSWSDTVRYDAIYGRRRDGMQLDRPNGEPWPVEQAVKVARWRYLLHTANLPASAYTDKQRHVQWAQRLMHGLPLTAADAEVEAFHPDKGDIHARRELAVAYLAVHDRLSAGEAARDIEASITPVGAAAWRLPDGEPESCHPQDLRPGWLVAGIYDHGYDGYRPRPGFTGPVAEVGEVKERHENGRWVTVRLTSGAERDIEICRWVAYYPAGAPQPGAA